MASTSSPASPISCPNSRSNIFCTTGLVSGATARLASVSVVMSDIALPARRSESAAKASDSSLSLHPSWLASFLRETLPPSAKRRASACEASVSIFDLSVSVFMYLYVLEARSYPLAISWYALRFRFERHIRKKPFLRDRNGARPDEFKRGEKIYDDFMLTLRLGQLAELCAERSRQALFETAYHVFERENRRDRRAYHFFGLRQKRKEAGYRTVERWYGAFGRCENSGPRRCPLRQKQRRSSPLLAQEFRCLAYKCVAREAAFQFLDTLAFIVGEREHGQERARFDEKQGRSDQNELRGLAERKFGKFFDVCEVRVGHLREGHFGNRQLALLDQIEEGFQWTGVCLSGDTEFFHGVFS